MQLSSDGQRIRLLIKRLMKKNGYRYTDLARLWGVSTPTVKRIMTRDEMSLERLISVAGWLKISLHDLIGLATEDERGSASFTDAQEEHLAKRPLEYLYFQWMLIGRDHTALSEKLGLSAAQVRRILRSLDALGLIDIAGDGPPRLVTPGPFQMKFAGPLERAYFKRATHAILRHVAGIADRYRDARNPQELTLVRPFEMVLRPETYRELITELRETVLKYRSRSRLEMLLEPAENLRHASGIVACDFYYPWIDALKEAMG